MEEHKAAEITDIRKNETSRGRSLCGIVLRRRSSRRKVAELEARTRDLTGARTRVWAAAILVDTSSQKKFYAAPKNSMLRRTPEGAAEVWMGALSEG
jgi:hypothetical protein